MPWERARAVILRDRWFAGAVAVGVVLRIVAVLGFYPVLWYNDSFEYLGVAMRWQAYPIRPAGYSAFLVLLRPFHSLALVVVLQHLMGVAIAVLLYALMRRFDVRQWIAVTASLPQLLDSHQIELEHMLLSDTLFTFLAVLGVTMVAWRARLSVVGGAAIGAALGVSALVRTIGLPLILFILVALMIRRAGWRPVVAFVAVAAVFVGGYSAWYHSERGRFSTTTADGIFLYARVAGFADCNVMKPSAELAVLCDKRPDDQRPPGPNYIWHPSPLDNVDGRRDPPYALDRFTAARNDRALKFALKAIRAQPLDYLHASLRDVVRAFDVRRENYPSAEEVGTYQFSNSPKTFVTRVVVPGATPKQDADAYEHGNASTRVHRPWSTLLEAYQKVMWLRGPLLLGFLLIALAGLVWRWRDRRRGVLAFVWGSGVVLLVLPDFLAQFDNRYVMPAVPLAAAGAALAVEMMLRPRAPEPAVPPTDSSAGRTRRRLWDTRAFGSVLGGRRDDAHIGHRRRWLHRRQLRPPDDGPAP